MAKYNYSGGIIIRLCCMDWKMDWPGAEW